MSFFQSNQSSTNELLIFGIGLLRVFLQTHQTRALVFWKFYTRQYGYEPEWLLYADDHRPPLAVQQRLTTTEAENTVRTDQDLINYVDRLLILNYFAQQLRISDLHSENIFICRDRGTLQLYVIDAEVNGDEEASGIENVSSGPLYRVAGKDNSALPAGHRFFFF